MDLYWYFQINALFQTSKYYYLYGIKKYDNTIDYSLTRDNGTAKIDWRKYGRPSL